MEEINKLAFDIMHTEDLNEIHGLANKIYLISLRIILTLEVKEKTNESKRLTKTIN